MQPAVQELALTFFKKKTADLSFTLSLVKTQLERLTVLPTRLAVRLPGITQHVGQVSF